MNKEEYKSERNYIGNYKITLSSKCILYTFCGLLISLFIFAVYLILTFILYVLSILFTFIPASSHIEF